MRGAQVLPGCAGRLEDERIGRLLTPLQARLRAVESNVEIIVLPACDLRAHQRAARAPRESHENAGIIIEAASCDDGGEVRANADDRLAGYEFGEMRGVCSDIADTAAGTRALRVGTPLGLTVARSLERRHEPILLVFDEHLAELAQSTRAYQLARLPYERIAAVVVSQRKQRRP